MSVHLPGMSAAWACASNHSVSTSNTGTVYGEYKGGIAAGDEIKFTRQVGEFATEQPVAKRAK